MTEITHFLWQRSPIGKELSEAEARELHLISKRQSFQKGEDIFRSGDPAREFFLIVTGEVAVIQRLEDERVITLADLGPLSLLGEMSLLSQENRSATARAMTDTTLLRVEWRDFEELQKDSPQTAYKLLVSMARVLANRLKRINMKVVELTTATNASVPDKKLEEFADFKQKLLSNWSF